MTPLLHVGYHKTASTWLQQMVFRRAAAGCALVADVARVNDLLVHPNSLDWDASEARAALEPEIAAAEERALVPVVSSERLSGSPHTGGYDTRTLADRLHAAWPDARVLVVVREQRALIRSVYLQYIRQGGVLPLRAYLEPPRALYRVPTFDPRHFDYDRFVGCYRERFGAERVHVVPYELLRKDPPAFVAEVLAAAGVWATPDLAALPYDRRSNPSLSAASAAVRRQLNRLVAARRPRNPGVLVRIPAAADHRVWDPVLRALDAVVPESVEARAERRLRNGIAAWAGDRYGASNRRLAERLGLDLAAYGYEVG
jgi:Sulfotransferase family